VEVLAPASASAAQRTVLAASKPGLVKIIRPSPSRSPLPSRSPPPKRGPLTILSTDFHISPIADLKDIAAKLATRVHVNITDLSLSGSCSRSDTCAPPGSLAVLRHGDWEGGIYASAEAKRAFFTEYASVDSFVSKFDAVVCMHPTGMCEFYMPFNSSMIIWSTTRFEQGREGDPARLTGFVKNFRAIAARPGNVVLANNLYDVHYIHYFTGILPVYLPSLCTYPAVKYAWSRTRAGGKMQVLVHGFRPRRKMSEGEVSIFLAPLRAQAAAVNLPYDFVPYREALGSNYAYKALVQYPALLYLPYQVSVMSFYEHYRMGIPILAPSLTLLTAWHMEYLLVSERTWDTALAGSPKTASAIPRHAGADELYDPNDEFDEAAVRYWLGFSDFYVFPHVLLFDSWEHLVALLQGTDLEGVSKQMLAASAEQETAVAAQWERIFTSLPRAAERRSALFGSFDERMNAIYGEGAWEEY
jgi:hypothetical protein